MDRDPEPFSNVLTILRNDFKFWPKFSDLNSEKLLKLELQYWGMPSDEKEMKIKFEYSAEFWDLFRKEPVDLNEGIIAQWKDLGPIDLCEYLQKSNF